MSWGIEDMYVRISKQIENDDILYKLCHFVKETKSRVENKNKIEFQNRDRSAEGIEQQRLLPTLPDLISPSFFFLQSLQAF